MMAIRAIRRGRRVRAVNAMMAVEENQSGDGKLHCGVYRHVLAFYRLSGFYIVFRWKSSTKVLYIRQSDDFFYLNLFLSLSVRSMFGSLSTESYMLQQ